MAEAAIARREARRKKILENSHNRLQLISGKNANDVGKESPTSSSIFDDSLKNSPSKESCNINKCLVNNGVLTNAGLETLSFLSTNQEDFAIGDGDVPFPKHDSTAFASPTPEPVQ
ncbi:unnamed protein product [Danaus chrysippus]|uniref:(African queen) hypothetical protein n=1 Tax=Danaus chrysippus TaxID=151541 RepID=A0A8J2QKZ4_9NEOP|nr:unnamed protein product [Danaus chrysippus]